MGWIDTHCHLNDDDYRDEIEVILNQAKQANVDNMIVIGYDMPSSQRAIDLAHQYDVLSAAVGVHPSDADTFDVYTADYLTKLVLDDSVVAIGEIGLDYYWEDNPPREMQKNVFRKQLAIAQEYNKPVVIHMRDATRDTYEILKAFPGIRGVMHCYSGSYEMALEFIKLGFYISLAGPVTFKNAREPKEVAMKIPLESLLIETDCPYLTPHPHRGKRNVPAYVSLVGEHIAQLRDMDPNVLQAILKENSKNLFDL